MRFRFAPCALILVFLSTPLAAAELFAIDPAQSTLRVSAHRLRSIAGHVYFNDKNPAASRLSIVIRAGDFVGSKTYPDIIFDGSSRITTVAKGFAVRGILWVRGTTRLFIVPFDFTEKHANHFTIAGHFTTTRQQVGLANTKLHDPIEVDFKFVFRRSNDMQRAMRLLAKNDTAGATKEVRRALDAAPHSSAARALGILLGIPLN